MPVRLAYHPFQLSASSPAGQNTDRAGRGNQARTVGTNASRYHDPNLLDPEIVDASFLFETYSLIDYDPVTDEGQYNLHLHLGVFLDGDGDHDDIGIEAWEGWGGETPPQLQMPNHDGGEGVSAWSEGLLGTLLEVSESHGGTKREARGWEERQFGLHDPRAWRYVSDDREEHGEREGERDEAVARDTSASEARGPDTRREVPGVSEGHGQGQEPRGGREGHERQARDSLKAARRISVRRISTRRISLPASRRSSRQITDSEHEADAPPLPDRPIGRVTVLTPGCAFDEWLGQQAARYPSLPSTPHGPTRPAVYTSRSGHTSTEAHGSHVLGCGAATPTDTHTDTLSTPATYYADDRTFGTGTRTSASAPPSAWHDAWNDGPPSAWHDDDVPPLPTSSFLVSSRPTSTEVFSACSGSVVDWHNAMREMMRVNRV